MHGILRCSRSAAVSGTSSIADGTLETPFRTLVSLLFLAGIFTLILRPVCGTAPGGGAIREK
jgi:hypothetical protein